MRKEKRRRRLYFSGGAGEKTMRYIKKSELSKYDREHHPSIHYTGSVRGMKELGYWGKNDVCVRSGSYIYNLSMVIR